MSKIILIIGVPGSGKTTIAERLAQHFPKSLHLWMVLDSGAWTIEQTIEELLKRIAVTSS